MSDIYVKGGDAIYDSKAADTLENINKEISDSCVLQGGGLPLEIYVYPHRANSKLMIRTDLSGELL